MEKTKLTKNEYLDSLDPDNLNLEKSDLINFCHGCIEEWKKNKFGNFKYIVAMELMIGAVRITPEDVMKTVWKKIIDWFWDLQFQNAVAEKEGMIWKLRELGSG